MNLQLIFFKIILASSQISGRIKGLMQPWIVFSKVTTFILLLFGGDEKMIFNEWFAAMKNES